MRSLLLVVAALTLAPAASAILALPADLSAHTPNTALGPATVYPTYPLLTAELQGFAAEYKDIARLHSAGTTARGLHLWYVEVADFENASKVPLENREVLYIDGGTHANEYIGVIFVMHILKWLAEGYGTNETATWIVENRHTIILPLVNPEGSMNGVGRLNDNLVNINRNFPVGWADVDETPVVNNPGPYPGSEKETQAVMGVWAQYDPDYILSIHCCGNLWLYPYGIEGRESHADDHQVFERICDEILFDVREGCGPTWSTIYPASGVTSDAGYELTGANSWTFEMKRSEIGEDPLAAYPWPWGPPAYTGQIEVLQKESWRAVQHAFLNVHRYGGHPVLAVDGIDAGAVRFTVTNEGWGNLTSATVAVTDAAGALRQVRVPALAPGQSTGLSVAGSFGAGSFPLSVEYAKRPLAAPGVLGDVLEVAADGQGLVASLGGTPLASGATEDARPLPAAGLGTVLGAMAALALVLRRR